MIAGRDVEVWYLNLDGSHQATERFRGMLSDDERSRAEAFRFPDLRRKFTLARGVLRVLAGRYTGVPPEAVTFQYNAAGKPELWPRDSGLSFNLSHSGGLAAYAFAMASEVGIDVEQVRPIPDLESIAARHFSAPECSELFAADPASRCEIFYRIWTRKEAYVKAIGSGLSIALKSLDLGTCSLYSSAGRAWSIHSLAPPSGYAGALVVDGSGRDVRESLLGSADDIVNPLS
jgi:4'-phosphopantetheinyl transferase